MNASGRLTKVVVVVWVLVIGVVAFNAVSPMLDRALAPRPPLPTARAMADKVQAQGFVLNGNLADGYDIFINESGPAKVAEPRVDIHASEIALNSTGLAAARYVLSLYPPQVLADFDLAVPTIEDSFGQRLGRIPYHLSPPETIDYNWGEMILNLEGPVLRVEVIPS